MTITIFKKTGEVHFDHDGVDDYDGDTGEYEEIEVDDEKVHNDAVRMFYEDYFAPLFKGDGSDAVKQLIDDFDAWNSVVEMYADELRHKYEEEYNRG